MAKSVKKKQVVAKSAGKVAKAQVPLEERVETLERNVLILALCVAGLIGFVLVYTVMDDETLWWKKDAQTVVIEDEVESGSEGSAGSSAAAKGDAEGGSEDAE